MNSKRNAARRLEAKVSNVGDPPHDDKVPPLEEKANVDQAPANPPPMMEAEMRAFLAHMAQAMTTNQKTQRFNPKL